MSIYNVLLLPLDVANQGGNFEASGGLPMGYLTLSFFLATVILRVETRCFNNQLFNLRLSWLSFSFHSPCFITRVWMRKMTTMLMAGKFHILDSVSI